MATGKWSKNDQQKAPQSFSNFSARFRQFSHFLGCLFLTGFGRPFSHFFAPFACCHLAAAIWIPLTNVRWLQRATIEASVTLASGGGGGGGENQRGRKKKEGQESIPGLEFTAFENFDNFETFENFEKSPGGVIFEIFENF